ncbi:MAG TPA: ABC transporter permease [Bryobacteraceae bacterium]|nr:ABC transporter permease [Bryobacteraceae bacterium]
MPFLRDLFHGLRLFRRNPAFYLLAVLIISVGVGATTAIFSLINGVLLHPLPYRDSSHLAVIWSDFSRLRGYSRALTAPALYFEWRDQSRSFEGMAALANANRTFTSLDQPITPLAHEVTPNFFDVAGVQAFRGRTFLPDEGTPGKDDVALLSYSLWRSAFAGSESTVGSSVELDGRSVRIVGVLPPGYRAPNNGVTVQPDLFLPASFEKQRMERVQRSMVVIGRLRDSVSLDQARAEIAAVTTQIARESPEGITPPSAQVNAIRDDLTGEFRRPFFLLQAAVGIMLLIACANVANLLLARYSARRYEFSVRIAIGASRGQIVRQLLAENLALSLVGGIGGTLFATWSVRPMLALVPAAAGLPFIEQVRVSPEALALALGLSLLSSVLFGLAPAREASRSRIAQHLGESGRSRSAGRSSALWRNALIAGEIGLSLILVASAGLLVRTFVHLSKQSWGFEPSHVLTIRNSLRGESYRTPSAQRNYFDAAVRKLREIPGVESVSAVTFPPPLAPFSPSRFVPSGQPVDPGHDPTATVLSVMPGYFGTLRIPIVSGRAISDADTADSALVAVISQSVVKRFFPYGNPVGQSFRFNGSDHRDWRIVGVAQDVRSQGLTDQAFDVLYLPHAQSPAPTMTFLIRTPTAPMTIANTAERSLWSLGKLMNVYSVGPLEERLSESYWQSRFIMALLAIFAALALLLATAGVYGVMSYLAAQRTREIGIRIAIGASPSNVIWLVTNQGLRAAAIGLGAGIAGYFAISRLLAGQLSGVTATDPVTLLAASIGLMLVCMAASAIPAFRAVRIDPLSALRHNA